MAGMTHFGDGILDSMFLLAGAMAGVILISVTLGLTLDGLGMVAGEIIGDMEAGISHGDGTEEVMVGIDTTMHM